MRELFVRIEYQMTQKVTKRKKSTLKKQMVITEEGEDVFYKLPGAKKRQPKNKHNLMEAVKNVRGAEKKH